jgi:Putative metal-binding motif
MSSSLVTKLVLPWLLLAMIACQRDRQSAGTTDRRDAPAGAGSGSGAIPAPARHGLIVASFVSALPDQHCTTDAQCGADRVCSKAHGDPLGTGLCVAFCGTKAAPTSVCKPGQLADTRNGCRCLGAVGAGSECSVSANDCPMGFVCTQTTAIWGASSPGGPVCVNTSLQTCSAAQACPGGAACPTVSGQTFGYCPDSCGTTSCRYDEEAFTSNGTCTCRPRDPLGRTCATDAECAWAGTNRTCTAVAGARKCMPTAFCAGSDTCNDGLDQDCSGSDRTPSTEICDNGIDEDCDGADRHTAPEVCNDNVDNDCSGGDLKPKPEVCGNGVDEDCDGRVDENPPCAPSQSWCHDDDGDGFCTECTVATAAPSNGRWVAGCGAREPAACGGDATRRPSAPEACDQLDSNCNGMADEPCPQCESSVPAGDGTPSLGWSCYRALPGYRSCIAITEAADPDAWADNYLCTNSALGLAWSSAGPIAGKSCIQVHELAEPAAHTWTDNYLCRTRDPKLQMIWSSAGPVPGYQCVQWSEPADPHTWSDNYLCVRKAEGGGGGGDGPCICLDGFCTGADPGSEVCRRVCRAHERPGAHDHGACQLLDGPNGPPEHRHFTCRGGTRCCEPDVDHPGKCEVPCTPRARECP